MSDVIIFNELDKIVDIPLSNGYQEKGKWQRMPYEASNIKGVGLVAAECAEPGEIELKLNVEGWYKIYICVGQIADSGVEVCLSNEREKTLLVPSDIDDINGATRWQKYERAEEILYRITNLTNQNLIINNPSKYASPVKQNAISSVVLYIKLEKVSDKELEGYQKSNMNKSICYHFDYDYYGECDYDDAKSYLGRVNMLEHGNGDMLIVETKFDNASYNLDKLPYKKFSIGFQKALNSYKKVKDEYHQLLSERCKKLNLNLYSGYRMGCGDFSYPYSPSNCSTGVSSILLDEMKCESRLGQKLNFYSYAYKEIRDYIINNILETTPSSFDGVSLFFHRGTFVLFEKPVYDRIMELYGVDAHKLPFSDTRLNSVLREYITLFMKELKAALEDRAKKENRERYKINVVIFQNMESCFNFGLDVEEWAKEGLIDNFSQGIMYLYEVLDECINKEGLIDLDKYSKLLKDNVLLRRQYFPGVELSMESIDKYVEISQKYNVDFYGNFAWEGFPYHYNIDLAEAMHKAGVKKMICWNANHFAKKPSLLNVIKECGNIEKVLNKEIIYEKRVVRLLSLNGIDISEYDGNWNG